MSNNDTTCDGCKYYSDCMGAISAAIGLPFGSMPWGFIPPGDDPKPHCRTWVERQQREQG